MPVPNQPITSEHMRRWNNLIAFARKKGYAGKPELDHDENMRKQVFDEYNKANPKDSVDYNMVSKYQDELQKYKQKALSAIQAGKGELQGANPSNFMSKISKTDGVFGSLTSNQTFPSEYEEEKRTGEKKRLGFAPQSAMLAALNK